MLRIVTEAPVEKMFLNVDITTCKFYVTALFLTKNVEVTWV